MDDNTLPISTNNSSLPALSLRFRQSLAKISDSAVQIAEQAYTLAYKSSNGKIILREDQIITAVYFQEGRDSIKIARTGSGKTMQIIITALLNPKRIVIVLSPLKRLQQAMVDELNTFTAIRAVAVNEDLHNDLKKWKEIETGEFNIILTSPEQCKRINGHPTRLSKLLREKKRFTQRIVSIVVDEGHLIPLWGLPPTAGVKTVFRPAWGRLWDLRLLLPAQTPFLVLTATCPPNILTLMMNSLRLRDPFIHKSSVNRSNQIYAVYPLVGKLSDWENLRMLIRSDAISLSCSEYIKQTPKTLIFMDNRDLIADGPSALYNFVPVALRSELRELGYIQFYHSKMSLSFLNNAYNSFVAEESTCRILFSSSCLSYGVNLSNVDRVLQYGLPEFMEDVLQRFGRNVRNQNVHGLSLLIYEPWASHPSAKPTSKEVRTSDSIKKYATSDRCRRAYIADFSADDSLDSLEHTAPFCCDNCQDLGATQFFDLQTFFPSPLLLDAPSTSPKRKAAILPKAKYRLTWQRSHFTDVLQQWLCSDVCNSEALDGMPSSFILSNVSIARLSRIHPSELNSASALTDILSETAEWEALFAESLFGEIVKFQYTARLNKKSWIAEYKAEKAKKKEEKVACGVKGKHNNIVVSDSDTGSEIDDGDIHEDDSEEEDKDVGGDMGNKPAERERKRICLGSGLSLKLL
ncbi:P-loop containing nucleoside triphosphate hydrolase protein [Dentipellis sp. KUC8613]|nr:P-loop containing nucleoside triphosphate hydrolase protein [Dentipellis sp. KUC8613]